MTVSSVSPSLDLSLQVCVCVCVCCALLTMHSFLNKNSADVGTCDQSLDPDNENQYVVWGVGGLGVTAFRHFLRAQSEATYIWTMHLFYLSIKSLLGFLICYIFIHQMLHFLLMHHMYDSYYMRPCISPPPPPQDQMALFIWVVTLLMSVGTPSPLVQHVPLLRHRGLWLWRIPRSEL